jgi:hypothetical protein
MICIQTTLICEKCGKNGWALQHYVFPEYAGNILNAVRKTYRKLGWIATTKCTLCSDCRGLEAL